MRMRWTADRWIAAGLAVFTGWYLVMAWRLPRFQMTTVVDAHVFPMALGCIQLLMAAWLWLKPAAPAGDRGPSRWQGLDIARGALLLLICLVYIEIMSPLGFVISTFAFLAVTPYVLGWRRWGISCLVALLVSGGVYALFAGALGVAIPRGVLPF